VPTATQHWAVRSSCVSLAAVTAGDPAAPTVVLIHGYPDTKEVWRPVLDRLAPEFYVIAYDVRGAGASTAPHGPAAYDLARLAEDFAHVCSALAPDRSVHLVGHDWGGIQGWEFVTAPRFRGRIASFTTIAGPALGHAVRAALVPACGGRALRGLAGARRSWYIAPLCLPGGPTIMWRLVLAGDRWRRLLVADHVPVDASYPAPTVHADGLHGANLYRRNVPRRLLAPAARAAAHAPVQLIVPAGDRFIPETYYEAAPAVSPVLRRRVAPGSHWAPRSEPALIAGWIAEFVREVGA
jgi:pimeloyl-ACP methyl ester carboxylesterase